MAQLGEGLAVGEDDVVASKCHFKSPPQPDSTKTDLFIVDMGWVGGNLEQENVKPLFDTVINSSALFSHSVVSVDGTAW